MGQVVVGKNSHYITGSPGADLVIQFYATHFFKSPDGFQYRNAITAATNDIGIINLPNGKQVAIAVFVSDSPADERTREAVIAKIAKAAWDRWSK